MEECLPQKPKVRKSLRSSDNRVIAARLKAQEMQRQHETTKAESDKAAWSQALKDLYEVYRQAGEEELEEQISNIAYITAIFSIFYPYAFDL